MSQQYARILQKMTPGTMGGESRVASTMGYGKRATVISQPPTPVAPEPPGSGSYSIHANNQSVAVGGYFGVTLDASSVEETGSTRPIVVHSTYLELPPGNYFMASVDARFSLSVALQINNVLLEATDDAFNTIESANAPGGVGTQQIAFIFTPWTVGPAGGYLFFGTYTDVVGQSLTSDSVLQLIWLD